MTRELLDGLAARLGIVVSPLANSLEPRRQRILERANIGVFLDVGAHAGQTGHWLRRFGYRGRIVSFEPLPDLYARLTRRCDKDPLRAWTARNLALGREPRKVVIHRSENSASSSLLRPTHAGLRLAPVTRVVADISCEMTTLDLESPSHVRKGENVFLKLDVQGYEREVLEGGRGALREYVKAVQMEVSFIEIYGESPSFLELAVLLNECGFKLKAMDPVLIDKTTGCMAQMDALFLSESIPGC